MYMLSTIGKIGGADGPTVVFVSGDIVPFIVCAVLGITAMAALIFWLMHRK